MCGLKIHEDHGAYPALLDRTLEVCEEYDVQLSIYTDSINETGHVETTIETIPHTVSAESELTDMILPVHQMEGDILEDRTFAEARVRNSTMATEEQLHDIGAIP